LSRAEPSFEFKGWAAVLIIGGAIFLIWYWMYTHRQQPYLPTSEGVTVTEIADEQKSLPEVAYGTQSLKYSLTTSTKHLKFNPPWVSFSLINDGPDDIYISTTDVHDLTDEVGVKENETINVDMKQPVIKELWMKSGGTAAVRIHAKLGKETYG